MAWSELVGFLGRGGWLMIPIAICSIAGLAVFLERIFRLRRSQVLPPEFVRNVFNRLKEGRIEAALGMCESSDAPVAEVFEAGIDHAGCERNIIESAMSEAGERAVYRLERFVDVLGSIATISPLLGLLGTVLGMIDVFQQVVESSGGTGGVQAEVLASGIWQALITTAAGLAVAIPVYLAYRYVLGRVDALAVAMEEQGSRLMEMLVPEDQRGRRSASAAVQKSDESAGGYNQRGSKGESTSDSQRTASESDGESAGESKSASQGNGQGDASPSGESDEQRPETADAAS